MNDSTDKMDVEPPKPMFPIKIRMQGFPIAQMNADGTVSGSIEALEQILANARGEPTTNAYWLWVVLHMLKKQRIIGS